MSRVQDYINRARSKASGQHLNFVGSKQNFVQQPNLYATGAGSTAPVKKSMPYVVVVSSASGAAVSNFDVLGSYQYINDAGMTAGGSLVVGSITLSSGIPGVSYRDLLYQAQNNPFTVGQTYLACSSPTAQLLETFTIVTRDANGTAVSIPIVPRYDPYQQQSGVLIVEQEYSIDGFTKLTFANILPTAVLTISWYPSININPARELTDANVVRGYADPSIIRK